MKPENVSTGKRMLFVLGAAVLSVVAGLAGAAVTADFLSVSSAAFPVSNSYAIPSPRPATRANANKVSAAAASSVVFYRKRASSLNALDKVFLPSDAVCAGAVLTSDGWVATAASALSATGELQAVFADKTTASVDVSKIVRDEATGIAYVKTDALHRDVVSFGDDGALEPADAVFMVTPDSVVSATVISPLALPAASRADYVESTEKLGRRIVMTQSGIVGSPVVDAGGAVVGIDLGGGVAVPSSFFSQNLRGVFTDRKVVRPALGVHYVSLDNLPNAKGAGLPASGAFVTGGGKVRATEKGSAAEAALLREGDVITMVERDRINGGVTLSERLQDYLPGAKIELTVMREEKQIKLNVILK